MRTSICTHSVEHFRYPTYLASLLALSLCGVGAKDASAQELALEQAAPRIDRMMHAGAITALTVVPALDAVYSGGDDGTVRRWDLSDRRQSGVYYLAETEGRAPKVRTLAASVDGLFLAIGTEHDGQGQGQLWLLDQRPGPRQGSALRRVDALAQLQRALRFMPDGHRLWSIAQDELALYDVERDVVLNRISDCPQPQDGDIDATGQLIVACADATLRTYAAQPPFTKVAQVALHATAAHVRVSPNGQRLALGYAGVAKVEVRSTASLALLYTPQLAGIDSGDLNQVVWSASGARLGASGTWRRAGQSMIRLWNDDGTSVEDVALQGGPGASITAMEALRQRAIPAPPAMQRTRNFGKASLGAADSILAGSTESILWSIPPQAQATAWQYSIKSEPRAGELAVDFSGLLVELWLAGSEQRLVFSALDANLRPVRQANPRLHRASPTAAGLRAELDPADGALLVNGQKLALPGGRHPEFFAVMPDGSGVIASAGSELFLLSGGLLRWQKSTDARVRAITVSGDSRLIVAAFADGTVRWFGAAEGNLLLSLLCERGGQDWVVWTPAGYYTASADAEERIALVLPPDGHGLRDWFHLARAPERRRPDVIRLVLETLNEQKALAEANGEASRADAARVMPPIVTIESPRRVTEVNQPELKVRVRVRSPGGAPLTAIVVTLRSASDQLSRLHFDLPASIGKNVQLSPGASATESTYEFSIPIPTISSTLYVQADTAHASSDAQLAKLSWTGPQAAPTAKKPNLFLLAVGVSEYKERRLNLTYPAKDAEDLTGVFERQRGKLYGEVTTRKLTNAEATRANILHELLWLRSAATQNDIAVLFLAGHGISNEQNGRYYFYPHDADIADEQNTMISELELSRAVGRAEGKMLLLLDTCHAGGAVEQRSMLREADVLRLTKQVASEESGVIVFSASTKAQSANEGRKWQNGVFTKALVEGLRGKADLRGQGIVSVVQLEAFVTARVLELTHNEQRPAANTLNAVVDFPLARVAKPAYRTWWFWGAMGLSAAAIIVGGVVGAAPWQARLDRASF